MAARAGPERRLVMLVENGAGDSHRIAAIASRAGWRIMVVNHGEAAHTAMSGRGAALSAIVINQEVTSEAACDLIMELKRCRPDLPVIMLTTSTSLALAVDAIRAGASDYLIKPTAADSLLHSLRVATTDSTSSKELRLLGEKFDTQADFGSMIGSCPVFRTALAKAALAARGRTNVLIEGEGGTGKKRLLRAMHAASSRATMPLRTINVRSVKPGDLGSLLFGHEQGAFPGAFSRKIGELQLCDGGTLVLDQVNRLPVDFQLKLAEAINQRRVAPVGARHSFQVDVRIFATISRNLTDKAGKTGIVASLLEALSPTSIRLPPLRERTADLPALVRFFLARINEQTGLQDRSITDDALSLLATYGWPGNIRQLQAVLFRASALSKGGNLSAADFPHVARGNGGKVAHLASMEHGHLGVRVYSDDGDLRSLGQIEADVIRLAIAHYRGRMSQVARKLGIGRSTLYRKLNELGIDGGSEAATMPPEHDKR